MKSEWINDETLDTLSKNAIQSICFLWDDHKKTFWRSTSHKSRVSVDGTIKNSEYYPTVSFKSIESLLTVLIEYPNLFTKSERASIKDLYAESLLNLDLSVLHSSLDSNSVTQLPGAKVSTSLNEFTLSIYIQALARLFELEEKPAANVAIKLKLETAVEGLANHSYMKNYQDKEIHRDHPFLAFHILRAFSFASKLIDDGTLKNKVSILCNKIISSIKNTCEYLLAKYQLGSITPSDSVALAFCSASLALDGLIANRKYIIASLKVAVASQDDVGGWPMGRLVHKNKDIEQLRLETSTYEIAWVLTTVMHQILVTHGMDFETTMTDDIYCKLEKSVAYAEKSSVKYESKDIIGWSSDQPFDFQLIESWTSSNVLQFATSVKKVKEAYEQQIVLRSFLVIYPNGNDWPNWLKWDKYKADSEIDHAVPIMEYLNTAFLKPITEHSQKLPDPDKSSVSALLFGPPGTSKTTIAKALSSALNWPLLMLSPGNFIEGGLESIERISQIVFTKLKKLSKVIVLFDECDELFRERVPSADAEQFRGITAFITASMLPKLQDLHDNGKVVFFICTNNFGTIDSAIKRGGRIDHILAIGPPDELARKNILTQASNDTFKEKGVPIPEFWPGILEKMATRTERYTRPELTRLAKLIVNKQHGKNENEIKALISATVTEFDKSLTITVTDFTNFMKQKNDFSHAIINK